MGGIGSLAVCGRISSAAKVLILKPIGASACQAIAVFKGLPMLNSSTLRDSSC
jgi:hypothetical protein